MYADGYVVTALVAIETLATLTYRVSPEPHYPGDLGDELARRATINDNHNHDNDDDEDDDDDDDATQFMRTSIDDDHDDDDDDDD